MVKCPYNEVMSFIYRYRGERSNGNINVLELGSGDGNNLWYLAKEGFKIHGVELNSDRIKNAYQRLNSDNLQVDIKEGSFTKLDFDDESMELVFDRGAVTCVSLEDAKKTINETNRVLKRGGKFYFNPYSELDNNFIKGNLISDGRVGNFDKSSILKDYKAINFYSLKDIYEVFNNGWNIIEINHVQRREIIKSRDCNSAVWEVIVEKI